jgi:hypothetical protein
MQPSPLMATRISLATIARVCAGLVAAVWALLGLGSALAAGTGHGFDAFVAIAVAVNLALALSAVFAFTNMRNWRAAMILSLVAVTVERIIYILGSGDLWLAVSSVAMLVAVVGIVLVAQPK